MADKAHNARSVLRGLGTVGEEVWKRFSVGKEDTLWYYQELVSHLGEPPAVASLAAVVPSLSKESLVVLGGPGAAVGLLPVE